MCYFLETSGGLKVWARGLETCCIRNHISLCPVMALFASKSLGIGPLMFANVRVFPSVALGSLLAVAAPFRLSLRGRWTDLCLQRWENRCGSGFVFAKLRKTLFC
jgi:hypothetical protein